MPTSEQFSNVVLSFFQQGWLKAFRRWRNGRSFLRLIFQGNDGGASITALTLDMSAAGAATFNNDVTAFSDKRLKTDIKTKLGADSKITTGIENLSKYAKMNPGKTAVSYTHLTLPTMLMV